MVPPSRGLLPPGLVRSKTKLATTFQCFGILEDTRQLVLTARPMTRLVSETSKTALQPQSLHVCQRVVIYAHLIMSRQWLR